MSNRSVKSYKRQIIVCWIITAVCLIVTLGAIVTFIDSDASRFFEKATNNAIHQNLVDVVFVDSEPWDEEHIRNILRPAIMVWKTHYPKLNFHFRWVIYNSSLPFSYRHKNAVAMYVPDEALFLIDRRVFDTFKSNLAMQQMIVGHEAMHLVQHMQGRVADYVKNHDRSYHDSPIEVEATIEGLTVASIIHSEDYTIPFGGIDLYPRLTSDYATDVGNYVLKTKNVETFAKYIRNWM